MTDKAFQEKAKAWRATRIKEIQGPRDAEGNAVPEDNDDERDAAKDAEDAKEESQPIKYTILGSEDCPVDPEDEQIEFAMSYRIPKIEGLEQCT